MKNFSLLTVFMLFVFNVPVAQTSLDGTITGTISVAENRNLRLVTEVNHATFPEIPNVKHVVVAVTAISAPPSEGDLPYINPTFYAVTDDNGNFTSPWQDQTRTTFPVSLRITVFWESSNEAGGGTERPETLFRIRRFNSPAHAFSPSIVRTLNTRTNVVCRFLRPLCLLSPNRNLNRLGVLTVVDNDESAAYLTTQGFFEQIVNSSEVLRNRMPGLEVTTRALPCFGSSCGMTPFPNSVLVSEGTPINSPLVLAHEIGHAITWAALDLDSAPINLASDYSHPLGVPSHWDLDEREFSKAAFLEGLAEAWALEWAFGSNVNAVVTEGTRTFRYEVGRVVLTDGTIALNCKTVTDAHEFPFCHTVALRDLLDSGGAGTDGVDLTYANIVDTLNRFRDGICNGCRDELGFDALNNNDFLCNATPTSRRIDIRSVWSANGISGAPGSDCGQ